MRSRSIVFLVAATLPSSSCEERTASLPHPREQGSGVWVCPMCPEVARPAAGSCPRCRMALVGARTARVFSCHLHPQAAVPDRAAGAGGTETPPGEPCPFCGRILVPVTMTHAWRCPDHPREAGEAPGDCPRCGEPLEERFEPLPHGDHNPRHGGILFMAPDQWHHLEGAWTSPDTFRLYFYDDFTRPLAAGAFRARVLLGGEGPERSSGLAPAGDGAYLEGRIGPASAPLAVTALVAFAGKEERFDFDFPSISIESVAGPQSTSTTFSPTAVPAAGPASGSAITAAIPAAPEEIAAEVLRRDGALRQLIDRGAWDRLYLPALEAKELALALEERAAGLDRIPQADLARAVRAIVRGAWLLDLAGDRGDGGKAREEYSLFAEGIAGIRRLFPVKESRE